MTMTIVLPQLVHQKDQDLNNLHGCVFCMSEAKTGLVNYLWCEILGSAFVKL